MKQLTLRQIPKPVEDGLRMKAQESGRSLNRTAISVLEDGLGLSPGHGGKRRDLGSLAGRWTAAEARAFDRAVRIFDQIDADLWQQ